MLMLIIILVCIAACNWSDPRPSSGWARRQSLGPGMPDEPHRSTMLPRACSR